MKQMPLEPAAPIDHYGEAEAELDRADQARQGEGWQHVARAAIHALLALVDAIDDAGTEGIKLQ